EFPVGKIAIGSENGFITDISCGFVEGIENETYEIKQCSKELWEYFDGERTEFTVPIQYSGTPFQKAVLDATRTIPYGETRSYGDIAHMTGNPRAARAVGNAIHRNRLLILIPCHRIIQGDGSLGGYAGREDIKRYLLNLEKF
ncbi:MAG: methylated-DNA--[Clostridia bacterium]|nr:methylated-DNA--[protein]-cysteine S-methyltransferase [Clostridia bacterium]